MATTRAVTTAGMRFPFSGQSPVLSSEFGPELAAVSAARRAVRSLLTARQVRAETTQDMLVVVSELVTNAIKHAPGPYLLAVYAGTGLLGCAVSDGDPRLLALLPEPIAHERPGDQALADRGRGLALVTALALGRCGWHASEDQRGKSVWCLLDRG